MALDLPRSLLPAKHCRDCQRLERGEDPYQMAFDHDVGKLPFCPWIAHTCGTKSGGNLSSGLYGRLEKNGFVLVQHRTTIVEKKSREETEE